MLTKNLRLVLLAMVCLLTVVFSRAESPCAGSVEGTKGWERDGEYLKYYDLNRRGVVSGSVKDVIDVVPLPGMAPGVGLLVSSRRGGTVTVHLGPKTYVDTSVIGLKKGDKVKCLGTWAQIKRKEVFIALKVKKSEFLQMKLRRSRDGVPFWAMSVEELAEFTAEAAPTEEEFERPKPQASGRKVPPMTPPKPGLESKDKFY
jgi:hypothetical protein